MLLVANWADTKCCKPPKKLLKTLAHGYSSESSQLELSNQYKHDRVFRWFLKKLLCALDESSLSIGRVKHQLVDDVSVLVVREGGRKRRCEAEDLV